MSEKIEIGSGLDAIRKWGHFKTGYLNESYLGGGKNGARLICNW